MTESAVDPFAISFNKSNIENFRSLDFWGHFDSAVNVAGKADVEALPLWIIGGIWWCIHAMMCIGLTRFFSGAKMWTPVFHESLLKNVIAYDAIASHHVFSMCYRLLIGQEETKLKFLHGSIKEPYSMLVSSIPWLGGRRRTSVDVVGHIMFDLSRVWLIISSKPSPTCAWLVFGTAAWMYLFDFGEYVGSYGMYHGPWSIFILAKYYSATQQAAAISVLQVMLILLYLGCGLGKMGPWFTAVFNQEWTLPPWAAMLDLRPYLYERDFPQDNTPSGLGMALSYLAATTEWMAPLALMATSRDVGGGPGSASPYVLFGIFTLVAMHCYINFHMPASDVWMLNFTPAYLVFNAFYRCPTLPEPGFDYSSFAVLHPFFRYFCYMMVVYVTYGQLFPENMTYTHCYRFWAGNWPQTWLLISESGIRKVEKAFPVQSQAGLPGRLNAWTFKMLGMQQTAQLPHRVMPMAVHKALVLGSKARGEEPPRTLLEFEIDRKGSSGHGNFFCNWVQGFMLNDGLRCKHLMAEVQKECLLEAGEMMLVEASSFPVFAWIYGGQSHWTIMDVSKSADSDNGLVAEGYITVDEALAITRPSLWAGYEEREGKAASLSVGRSILASELSCAVCATGALLFCGRLCASFYRSCMIASRKSE